MLLNDVMCELNEQIRFLPVVELVFDIVLVF